MRLVTFLHRDRPQRPHIGALCNEDEIVDLTAHGDPAFGDMLALIDSSAAGLDRARATVAQPEHVVPAASVRLLAPLPEPRQMRDHLVFEQHLRQARANRHLITPGAPLRAPDEIEIPAVWYEQPIYYKCNRFSVTGPDTDVIWPSYSQLMDYELEIAAVIGKTGKNIPRERAREHIFGFCIFNDFSARDAQIREMAGQLGPAKGKDFDGGNALGPWLVTADEIADPYDLTMIARVNGEEWSRGSTRTMQHSFERMIEHVSCDETLHAGEILGSGTVGSGCGLELGRFLRAGDTVELEVTGLGILRNRVLRS